MTKHARPLIENVSEATAACLVTMVQGNLFALALSHWVIASQTGLLAGAATSFVIFAARIERPWVISIGLGVATTIVDYCIHEGMFGPFFLEAVVTGLGAAVLSFAVQSLFRRNRSESTS